MIKSGSFNMLKSYYTYSIQQVSSSQQDLLQHILHRRYQAVQLALGSSKQTFERVAHFATDNRKGELSVGAAIASLDFEIAFRWSVRVEVRSRDSIVDNDDALNEVPPAT